MNFNNDEEALDFFNRLLDRLRQAGYNQHGSHFQLVYVAPGAQHVERQTLPSPPCLGREKIPVASPCPPPKRGGNTNGRENGTEPPILPEVLATKEAMALWKKVREAGYVDEHYQPLLSRTQAALLADAMAERLGIKEKWKTFGELWNRQKMYKDYYNALNQQQSLEFQDILKALFD